MNIDAILQEYGNRTWWAKWFSQDSIENSTRIRFGKYFDTKEKVMILYDAVAQSDTLGQSIFMEQSIRLLQWHSEMPMYAFQILLSLYLPIVILGSLLNLGLLSIILSCRKLRLDPRNCFILTLAISDFLLCNFTSPLTLWSTLEGHWPFGSQTNLICRLVKAGQNFPVVLSSFCIGAIACDRFRFIMQPQKSQMTAKQGFAISLFLTFVSCSLVSPIFLNSGLWNFPFMIEREFYCEIDLNSDTRRLYIAFTSLTHYFLTFSIVTALYTSIYLRLKTRPPSQHESVNRKRRQTNILLLCITSVFFICWGPFVFYTLLHEFVPTIFPTQTVMTSVGYTLSLLFGMLTPIANPVFYGFLNDPFREVLASKLPWTKSYSTILNLPIQSLALSLPAIRRMSKFRIDEVRTNIFGFSNNQTEDQGLRQQFRVETSAATLSPTSRTNNNSRRNFDELTETAV